MQIQNLDNKENSLYSLNYLQTQNWTKQRIKDKTERLFDENRSYFDLYALLNGPEFEKIFLDAYTEANKTLILKNKVLGTIVGTVTLGISDAISQKSLMKKIINILPIKIEENLQRKVIIIAENIKKEYLSLLYDKSSIDKNYTDIIKKESLSKEISDNVDKIIKVKLLAPLRVIMEKTFNKETMKLLMMSLAQGVIHFLLRAVLLVSLVTSWLKNKNKQKRMTKLTKSSLEKAKINIDQASEELTKGFYQTLKDISSIVYETINKKF